jgi:hypothetical protein
MFAFPDPSEEPVLDPHAFVKNVAKAKTGMFSLMLQSHVTSKMGLLYIKKQCDPHTAQITF